MATALEILSLVTDPEFQARLTVAFSQAVYGTATAAADPNEKPEATKARLLAAATVVRLGPAAAQENVKKSLLLVLGAPEIAANGAKISDEDLTAVVGKILTAFAQFAAVGGAL